MKDFEDMTYEELLKAQTQIKSALTNSRGKAIKEKVDKIANDIDELCCLIANLGGDTTISCIRPDYLEDMDLHEYKSFLVDCFDFSLLFDVEE